MQRVARRLVCTLPPHRLMPMPRLSPSMRTGRIERWAVGEGDELDDTEVVVEVHTAELTDDPDDGAFVLEVEAHEAGYVARLLLQAGESAEPDEAIAVIVDHARDVEAFRDFPTAPRLRCAPATFAWQAYLKGGQSERSCTV